MCTGIVVLERFRHKEAHKEYLGSNVAGERSAASGNHLTSTPVSAAFGTTRAGQVVQLPIAAAAALQRTRAPGEWVSLSKTGGPTPFGARTEH